MNICVSLFSPRFYSLQDMEKSLNTNFHGPLNITRALLPKLRARGEGTLLFISSQAAWHADPSAAAYCAAKAALEGLLSISSRQPQVSSEQKLTFLSLAAVECLAKELGIFSPRLRVLIVEPGYFGTRVFSNIDHVPARMADYAQFNEGVRAAEAGLVGSEPGDARKAVERMIEIVKGLGMASGKDIPLRVPLGTDTWQRIKAKCEETLKICNEWEKVAKSTDVA